MPLNIICLLVNVFHSRPKKDKKTSFNSPTLGSSAVLYEKLLLGKMILKSIIAFQSYCLGACYNENK